MNSQVGSLIRLVERFLPIADIKAALPIILDLIVQNTSAERCRIEIFDDDESIFAETATESSEKRLHEEDKISRRIIEIVKKRHEVFETPNAMQDRRLITAQNREDTVVRLHVLSAVCAPLLDGDALFGLLYIDKRTDNRRFSEETRLLISDFARMLSGIAGHLVEPLKRSLQRAKTQRRQESRYIETRRQNEALLGYDEMLGTCPEMKKIYRVIESLNSWDDINVLILGESGTGKELVARDLHRKSKRQSKEFVTFDCSTVPESMIEATLFGSEKGAFTDAKQSRPGMIEEAEGGTLFLDEIGNISLNLQQKLLRFLQEKTYRRLGSNKEIKADVRLVFATNENLPEHIQAGKFREDLYYRLLEIAPIELPPLRKRDTDVLLLADKFLQEFNNKHSLKMKLSEEAKQRLLHYQYPGNIRELKTIINSAVFNAVHQRQAEVIEVDDLMASVRGEATPGARAGKEISFHKSEDDFYNKYLPAGGRTQNFIWGKADERAAPTTPGRTWHSYLLAAIQPAIGLPLEDAKTAVMKAFERNFLMVLLRRANGTIQNAAEEAGIERRTFSKYMAEHGIEKNWYKE